MRTGSFVLDTSRGSFLLKQILADDHLRDMLQQEAKFCLCDENVLFLEHFFILERVEGDANRLKMMQSMHRSFLAADAQHCVNVSSGQLREFERRLLLHDASCYSVLEDIGRDVFRDLKSSDMYRMFLLHNQQVVALQQTLDRQMVCQFLRLRLRDRAELPRDDPLALRCEFLFYALNAIDALPASRQLLFQCAERLYLEHDLGPAPCDADLCVPVAEVLDAVCADHAFVNSVRARMLAVTLASG